MPKIIWANFLHIYQPPGWQKSIILKVAKESYRPLFKILLKNHRIKITFNITASLTEQLIKYGLQDIVHDIKTLARSGQLEFTGSAKYHPILSLLPENEIRRQIFLNYKTNKKYFGSFYKPVGFYPPEMAVNAKLFKLISRLGYKWIIADEICYKGKIGQVNFNEGYKIKNTSLNIVFRNRVVSNYLYFEADLNNPSDFWQKVKEDNRSNQYLITGLDGEDLGHHRRGLDKLWKALISNPNVNTQTVTELLKIYRQTKIIKPLAGSWSTRESEIRKKVPFSLWQYPDHPIHKNLWLLTFLVIKTIENSKKDKNYQETRSSLDKSIYSDPYWWASARPWWSKEIVDKGTERILNCLYTLKNPPKKSLALAKKIYNKVTRLTNLWQRTGKAKRISENYLKMSEDKIRYLGGRKISATSH